MERRLLEYRALPGGRGGRKRAAIAMAMATEAVDVPVRSWILMGEGSVAGGRLSRQWQDVTGRC
jgi:hypothetical protein